MCNKVQLFIFLYLISLCNLQIYQIWSLILVQYSELRGKKVKLVNVFSEDEGEGEKNAKLKPRKNTTTLSARL